MTHRKKNTERHWFTSIVVFYSILLTSFIKDKEKKNVRSRLKRLVFLIIAIHRLWTLTICFPKNRFFYVFILQNKYSIFVRYFSLALTWWNKKAAVHGFPFRVFMILSLVTTHKQLWARLPITSLALVTPVRVYFLHRNTSIHVPPYFIKYSAGLWELILLSESNDFQLISLAEQKKVGGNPF